ncbi:hypothetical protein FDECE_636 [Fusarium decemcellulare]|nr:hypothetical protein FDECE_636 [Fusarium decemcellulare]
MIKVRQATPKDLPYVQDIMFSALIDSHDALFAYNFPHREKYPRDNEYFYSKLRIEPSLYQCDMAMMIAEISVTDQDGCQTWAPVGLAAWSWTSASGSPPPIRFPVDTWSNFFSRAYLNIRNYIISSFMPRRDMDGAHYNAFFTILKQVEDDYWRPRHPELLHLQALYTHSEAWGKGVGTTLVGWGLDAAREAQVPVVVESTGATKFYENRGFTKVCTKRIQVESESDFVDVDALVWVPQEVEAL